MPDTLFRQWLMLQEIPRYPRKVDTGTIKQHLRDRGYEISHRSIQRDLIKLSSIFPLVRDDNKPAGWSWARNGEVRDIPGMDPHTALTFDLVKRYMADKLPVSTLRFIEPHLKRAVEVLKGIPGKKLKSWTDRVRVIQRGMPMLPAELNPDVLGVVYDALLDEVQFIAQYRPRQKDRIQTYTINPLGLVFRENIVYLVCTLWEYEDVVQFALHRMLSAELTDEVAKVPDGFDLDQYIEKGEFAFLVSEKPLKLRVKIQKYAAFSLRETPVSKDQKIIEKDDHVILSATVPDTVFLRNWILGMGSHAEVLSPKKLRKEFADQTRRMAQNYT